MEAICHKVDIINLELNQNTLRLLGIDITTMEKKNQCLTINHKQIIYVRLFIFISHIIVAPEVLATMDSWKD